MFKMIYLDDKDYKTTLQQQIKSADSMSNYN